MAQAPTQAGRNPPAAPLDTVLAYHERTKHYPGRYARAAGSMDWATQPDPFRRFDGAPLLPLALVPAEDQPRYEPAFVSGSISPARLDRLSVSQLFQDALALSAWKQSGEARWSLRVNPSSGNLHPTEGYLISGPVEGLAPKPAVYHYAPYQHALERRADLSELAWAALREQLPPSAVLVGLTSIHWRESRKYGERAFRYCQHDVGHAIGALTVAAAGLGWEARLLEGVTDPELARLLGVDSQSGMEAEHADCLLAVYPQGLPRDAAFSVDQQRAFTLGEVTRAPLWPTEWLGTPNRLSDGHHPWPVIDEVAAATRKSEAPGAAFWDAPAASNSSRAVHKSSVALRPIVHQRRSAVAFDGRTSITRETFGQLLLKVLPSDQQIPFATLPWRPRIDLLLFVHRVEGVVPGLYALLRDPLRKGTLQPLMAPGFVWTTPDDLPASLPLFLLEAGDARPIAAQTSCGQEIASDGVLAVAMLADYRVAMETLGPWFYRRLYWEAGLVGQQLYLEAEAAGLRATGIGCFFDDLTHRTFGIQGDRFQVLYHLTLGGALEDPRIRSAPPYRHLERPR
jgi:SagB-type dehydrogenase family enzyme